MDAAEYVERVYAGVLGKMIGVYMGRPFEGWTYERIMDRFGEVSTYVNEELGLPLVVTDDDIAGTFTFVRALEDYGYDKGIGAREIGRTWLNYLVYKRTILWWGGLGNSTEHTAYLRLRDGVVAPASGSAALNGTTTANQIGAQIFIDGWALVSPGEPEQAARLAREAASVSHDEEAVNAAVVVAVMESEAFSGGGVESLLDAALSRIPPNSLIARLTRELLEFRRGEKDWRAARAWLDRDYGYDKYKGVCHVVPNYALVIMSLLYGEGDFRKSLMIANTSGRDTDCNAGTVGCVLGIRNGLAAIEACPDLREPHGDLLFLSSADGGRCVSDAAREALFLANAHFRMDGLPPTLPKGGARYHFSLPGSLHGFHSPRDEGAARAVSLRNVPSPPAGAEAANEAGGRALEASFSSATLPALVAVPTFVPPDMERRSAAYECQASPSLYPGQTIRARLYSHSANAHPIRCRLYVSSYGPGDVVARSFGPASTIEPGRALELAWKVELGIQGPIMETGVELLGGGDAGSRVYLLSLDWRGSPECVFGRVRGGGDAWKRAWVNGVDEWGTQFPESFRLSQNEGTGLIIQGTREWTDYAAQARVTPSYAAGAGLAVRVQGMRRYYALVLCRDGFARLVKESEGTRVLAELDIGVEEYVSYECRLEVEGSSIVASIDGKVLFRVVDAERPLESGALGLLVTEGSLACDEVLVGPVVGKGIS